MLTAINIDLNRAQEIDKLDDNTVLISINQEYEPLPRLKLDRLSSKILTLQFNDITAPVDVFMPMSPDQGLKILDFVNINKNKNFIIHCAAGISRSSAIALFIHLNYGHKLKENFWKSARPNAFVLGRLTILRNKKY